MNQARRRRRHGRKSHWELHCDRAWWDPRRRRWDVDQTATQFSNKRYLFTAKAARRAAREVARLGGGELIRVGRRLKVIRVQER